ncbi:MAG: polysaccharide biosynthesis protein, partial [Cyanobacteria bacterium J06638_7]
VLQTAFLWAGAHFFGLVGALAGQAAALALAYVPTVFLARKHGAWDPLHDVVIGTLALFTAAGALWLSQDAVMALVSGIGP